MTKINKFKIDLPVFHKFFQNFAWFTIINIWHVHFEKSKPISYFSDWVIQ